MSLIEQKTSKLVQLQSDVEKLEGDLIRHVSSPPQKQFLTTTAFDKLTLTDINQLLHELNLPKTGKKSTKISRLLDSKITPNHLSKSAMRILLKTVGMKRSGTKSEIRARLKLFLDNEFEDIDLQISTLEERLSRIDDEFGVFPEEIAKITNSVDKLNTKWNQ